MTRKTKTRLQRAVRVTACLLLPLTGSGCKNQLAFGTATKFGLDISQRADQTVEVTMGYRRSEVASIPVPEKTDANNVNDAYSVLGRFNVTYGQPFKGEGLHLKQFFATGMAARAAAGSAEMRQAFGEAASEIKAKQDVEKQEGGAK